MLVFGVDAVAVDGVVGGGGVVVVVVVVVYGSGMPVVLFVFFDNL
jgi:hypothetical protein